jgi:hypothetical protein
MQAKASGLAARWKSCLWLFAWLIVSALPAWTAETEEVNNGQDPTKPLTRLDFRYQYLNLPPSSDDNAHIFTLRADKPFVLAPGWSLATRLDVPLFLTEAVSRDNLRGVYQFGQGDLLMQGLLINSPTSEFAWAVGAQTIFPTAREEEMGGGKYRLVPTAGARYNLPAISKGSWAALLLRYDFDLGGDDSRSHVSELQLAPLVNFALPDRWFLNLYPSSDIKINLGKQRPGDKGSLFLPLNFMVGKMLTQNLVGSVEIGFPLIDDYRVYDFKMEWRVGFFF